MSEPSESPRHTNRLAAETSPYLLQHAHNPVDWFPWGPEALARARTEEKPIFLSIGYAACHWCHVMERESFEDEATAAQLNRDFVPIKVDREERPDLDAVYMDAVQAMTGQGGWPMSVFLTPDGKPFYGGTYFPDERRHGMPSFRDVLDAVQRSWREKRADVQAAGDRLVAAIDTSARTGTSSVRRAGEGPATTSSADSLGWSLEAAAGELERGFDTANGGWGRAPKFPQSMVTEVLLRHHHRSGDPRSLAVARRSLDRMAAGGIHDHLGGGFARYATDPAWLVPHFEKMLYDNAQLARVYLHAWQLTDEPLYRDVTYATLDYLRFNLTTPDGAFAASEDADTDGVEGATYVWRAAEIREVLAEDTPLFAAAYGVTDEGNWEGVTILQRLRTDSELAERFGLRADEVANILTEGRQRLLDRRRSRPQPARDAKALAAWNGLAIAALSEAARTLDAQGEHVRAAIYRQAAEGAARSVLSGLLGASGRLKRSWKDDRATGDGVLEDHTHLADGLLALYEATFEERWFVTARDLMEIVLDHFADPSGGFFDTADDAERLVTRPKGLQDNALPSGNAMAATVLLRLHALTGEGRYRAAAEGALSLVTPVAHRYPTAFGQWLIATDLALGPLDEVAIVGSLDDGRTGALRAVVDEGYRPRQVVALSASPDGSAVPLLHGRVSRHDQPTAYVCRGFSCRLPVSDPDALRAELMVAAGA
ncbi:MAG: thioredoxin domain-containing protein [Chloroflexi bacterium]|nr:thioredoxin domain-containing protein [Chloroflexota bacterium]